MNTAYHKLGTTCDSSPSPAYGFSLGGNRVLGEGDGRDGGPSTKPLMRKRVGKVLSLSSGEFPGGWKLYGRAAEG